ncbi:MAG: RadC family protein [Oscillospiraceae bacterium]|nr:RadC family protein [Oscillospiraceae bacterium]
MPKDQKNVHAGHRERMRKKYLRIGIEGFEEHEILEMLLFCCFAQKDTNELAHVLIKTFGSINGVLAASIDELKAVDGIGDVSAFRLKLIGDIVARGQIGEDKRPVLNNSDKISAYAKPFFASSKTEMVLAISLDQKLRVMRTTKIHEGSFDSVSLPIAKIVRNLVASGAAAVVIAHNHPFGLSFPSMQDIRATEKLKAALESVGIMFVDHVVFGIDDCVSFRDSGDNLYALAQ